MTDFSQHLETDGRTTIQKLSASVQMSEEEFWEQIRSHLTGYPISELSKFLVEHAELLEQQGSEYFHPKIRQCAIMMQTLEGQVLALKEKQPEPVEGELSYEALAEACKELRDQNQSLRDDVKHLQEVAHERGETVKRQKARLDELPDPESERVRDDLNEATIRQLKKEISDHMDISDGMRTVMEELVRHVPPYALVNLLCKKTSQS